MLHPGIAIFTCMACVAGVLSRSSAVRADSYRTGTGSAAGVLMLLCPPFARCVCLACARAALQSEARMSERVSQQLHLPHRLLGTIIGSAGVNIKRIEGMSSARIEMNRVTSKVSAYVFVLAPLASQQKHNSHAHSVVRDCSITEQAAPAPALQASKPATVLDNASVMCCAVCVLQAGHSDWHC
jgi:KH domain